MSRHKPPRTFSAKEKKLVQDMRKNGCGNPEIARALGVTQCTLLWFIREGRFGSVPSRQGKHRGRKKNRPDCERTGRLFDCTDWKKRQAEIRDSWSEEEEERRRAGELPNVPDNYSRFKK